MTLDSGDAAVRLEPHRSPGAPARRVVHHRILHGRAPPGRARRPRGLRFHRPARPARPASGPDHRLPRRPSRTCATSDASASPSLGRFKTPSPGRPRRRPRLVRRHLRPGLRHQPRVGRPPHVRDHAPGRSPTSSCTAATPSTPTTRCVPELTLDDGAALEERGGRDQGPRGGDPRRLPRQLALQPLRRERAALQRRGAPRPAVGRPRGAQQLVSHPGPRRTRATQEKSVALLAARAKRAFFEYSPLRADPRDPERIYRALPLGPLVEVFVLDLRSYRGPNSPNRQTASRARRGDPRRRAAPLAGRAHGRVDGRLEGRGLRHAPRPRGRRRRHRTSRRSPRATRARPSAASSRSRRLLQTLKERRVRNVVFVTGDVHYAAAHHYDPARARFREFLPFWEFVAGPLHAGTFGPARRSTPPSAPRCASSASLPA